MSNNFEHCHVHDFLSNVYSMLLKLDLFTRALLLDRILALEKNTRTLRVHLVDYNTRQLGPRYEGQLTWMAEPICHSFGSLVRPHDYHHSGLRTDEQGRTERVLETRTLIAHHFTCRLWRRGWCTSRARTTTSFGPQRELPPARLVIHRLTSAQNNVGDAGKFRRGRAY